MKGAVVSDVDERDNEGEDLISKRTNKRHQARLRSEGDDWREGFDPVKMYLRRIGQVSLLTREGEVAIAKEIEAGREIVFDAIVNCGAGIEMVLAVPDRLKAGTARAREVFDEYEPSAEDSDMPVAPEVFKRFERVKKAYTAYEDHREALDAENGQKKPSADKVAGLERTCVRAHKKLVKSVRDCYLSQRFVNEVVQNLKEALENIDRSQARVNHYCSRTRLDVATLDDLVTRYEAAKRIRFDRYDRLDEVILMEYRQVRASAEAVRVRVEADLHLPIDELRRQFDVNVTGQIAVTQACLPLLRRARSSSKGDHRAGRIVFMSSVAGRSALPFMGAYAASKFALEAAADSLRVELRPFGIAVSLVEPGIIATPIWKTSRDAAERNIAAMPPQMEEYYGRAVKALRTRVDSIGGLPPEHVADAVTHALTSRRPRIRYVVGRDARLRVAVQGLLPDRVRDWLLAGVVGRL